MMRAVFPVVAVLLVGLLGCSTERHWLKGESSQVVRVESGDRFFLTLEENATTGYQWKADCDDDNVGVMISHRPASQSNLAGAPGQALVTIRIYRGYDGPSEIHFRYQRSWEEKPIKEFTITLFKRTGDCAFWE